MKDSLFHRGNVHVLRTAHLLRTIAMICSAVCLVIDLCVVAAGGARALGERRACAVVIHQFRVGKIPE